MAALLVEHDGAQVRLEPEQVLTFGRSGDLAVDADNQHLHRVLGCFAAHEGGWFVQNLGRFTTICVVERGGAGRVDILPDEQAEIGFDAFAVTFEAGGSHYEIGAVRVGA